MERYIGIDNVCAWPNLTLFPDGTIIATIFNQPCHSHWEGDVECWASTDGGRIWEKRGVPAPHEPGTARGNGANGIADDGAFVVIAGGRGGRKSKEEVIDMIKEGNYQDYYKAKNINVKPWVCRSYDQGRTWEHSETVIGIPFGDIVKCPDGTLGVSMYDAPIKTAEKTNSYFYRSRDDGKTWGEPVVIGKDDYNETDLLALKDGTILAAARTRKVGQLKLFASHNSGNTWQYKCDLTLPQQHPAHMLSLADGTILLVYGVRNKGGYGVAGRISKDFGENWSEPAFLVNLGIRVNDLSIIEHLGGRVNDLYYCDVGYPSSVQIEDGTIVTAYYCGGIDEHMRYHMGVVRWKLEEYFS